MSISLVIHGHFYQPPRENPWSNEVEREPSAAPMHDWNARIHTECYRANAFARVLDGAGRITAVVNNYERLSFDFGPTLARWIARSDTRMLGRLQAADGRQRRRLGVGGAMAQAYAHAILPLATPVDRRTQLLWGLADFRRSFGRQAEGMWLPETAADPATLEALIDVGVRYTILAPEQVTAVRKTGDAEWTTVDRNTVDTGRLYRWYHRDGSGRFLTVALFDGPLSRGVAFGDVTRDASAFVEAVRASAERSRAGKSPLVLCASDGELFGHHKKFADLTLAFAAFVEARRQGIEIGNIGAYMAEFPASWELALRLGPGGEGTAWSCAHGVGRWRRDCGCTMAPREWGWNQRWRTPLRAAMDRLQRAAADFYEDAASGLLIDPWGARDSYGEVIDGTGAERDAWLRTFAAPALEAGGAPARQRARLLLEMQRATLLMYASCAWYFDDVAGIEASLGLRLAAYAADLLARAGGKPPLPEILDILAEARSNQAEAGTGADVFRRVSKDRITPAHAAAEAAFAALGAAALGAGSSRRAAGRTVRTTWDGRRAGNGVGAPLHLTGAAEVGEGRVDPAVTLALDAAWDPRRGFSCRVEGVDGPIRPEDLGVEARSSLLSELLPRLANEGDLPMAARMALALGRDVLGAGDAPEHAGARATYARLLLRLLGAREPLRGEAVSLAVALVDAAGSTLAPGAPDRQLAEEMFAELLEAPGARARLGRLAERLGFAGAATAAGGDAPAPAAAEAEGQGEAAALP
jgi:hypothetical protein